MDVALQRELLEVAGGRRRGPHCLPHRVDGAACVAAQRARPVVVVTENKGLGTGAPVHHGADRRNLDREEQPNVSYMWDVLNMYRYSVQQLTSVYFNSSSLEVHVGQSKSLYLTKHQYIISNTSSTSFYVEI